MVGVDLSANMLERARAMTSDPEIQYLRMAIEDIEFSEGEFDTVISSLAIHYVERFDDLCRRIHHCLKPGGEFVLSVEHPIFTALAAQDWVYGPDGSKMHWPVDNYHIEGAREARFLDDDVIKYHRNITTYINTLIESGFTVTKLSELQPTKLMLEQNPAWQEELRRPMFLLIAAIKL